MKELFTLGKLNVSDFIPDYELYSKREKYELKLMLEEETGAVRLENPAPLNSMYGKYWYRSGINQTMKDELKNVVESILKVHKLKENDIWLDIACFPEGNFINTQRGNIDIKDIKVGDMVLSHDGYYHKVVKLFKRDFDGEFIKLKIRGLNLDTKVTYNHEYLTKRGWVRAEDLMINDYVRLGNKIYENVKQSDILNLYDVIKDCHPFGIKDLNNGYIESISNGLKTKLPKFIKIDEKLIKILAYYIGEGDSIANTGIRFTFNTKEIDKSDEIKDYFKNIFNIDVKTDTVGNTLTTKLNSSLLSSIFKYLCGKLAFNKKIPFQLLNKKLFPIFLKSLWFTDGHFSLHKTRHCKYKKTYVFNSVSKRLILDVWNILELYNIKSSVQHVKNNKGFSLKGGYIYRLTVERNLSIIRLENLFNKNTFDIIQPLNNIIIKEKDNYAKILKIEKIIEKNTVYNFKVDKSKTYVCNGVVVHNCNDGTMFDYIPKNIIKIGVDPCDDSYTKESEKKADLIIQDYFNYDNYSISKFGKMKAKVITVIAMFYDLDKPDKFLQDVYRVLDDDGLLVMQMSYTPLMLKQLAFDNICHEHIYYYSLFNIKKILERNGFGVVDCTLNDINGGSFRVFIKKNGHENDFYTQPFRDVANFRVDSLLEYEKTLKLDEKETWLNFHLNLDVLKDIVYHFIKREKENGKTIWGYGASTKGNTTLQYFGLDNTLITSIAERSTYKWGLKTVGTNIPICSEEEMRKAKPDYLLILPWHFINEFKEREKDYLIGGGKFIVPCPKFEVIGY